MVGNFPALVSLPGTGGCDTIFPMLYYYVVPCYLTAIFVASYAIVRGILWVFDRFNFFWDAWDGWKRKAPFLAIIELAVLGGFIYYIVIYELSGAPDVHQSHSLWQWLTSVFD